MQARKGSAEANASAWAAADDQERVLLGRIKTGLPEDVASRYRELGRKLRKEQITPEEHAELLNLVDHVEAQNVEWITALIKLAERRQLSLREMMDALGIKPPPVE